MIVDQHRVDMFRAWGEHDAEIFLAMKETLQSHGFNLTPNNTVLDIGCGENAPISLMLHGSGMNVTGIDHYVGHRWGLGFRPSRYLTYLKRAGLLASLRKVIGEFAYDRQYYKALEKAAGFKLTERGLTLLEHKAEKLPSEDASIDLIHSNATWEHIPDINQTNAEVARVLRPGGVAYIEIHLFPSLSGGHDLPWLVPGHVDLRGAEAWGHLRNPDWTEPMLPVAGTEEKLYLNRNRESDYRKSFESTKGLEIIDWMTEYTEAEDLVTDEILAELPGYTKEDLTKRSIIVIVKKTD